jgi:hypothetical protein
MAKKKMLVSDLESKGYNNIPKNNNTRQPYPQSLIKTILCDTPTGKANRDIKGFLIIGDNSGEIESGRRKIRPTR